MRLCLITDSYPSTTQTFVYEPVEWLRARGHRVDVIAARRGELPGLVPATHPVRIVPPWRERREKVRVALGSPGRPGSRWPRRPQHGWCGTGSGRWSPEWRPSFACWSTS